MPRDRTSLEKAAGKLISAIQKEWTAELGEPQADASEATMHASHSLLQAASAFGSIARVLGEAVAPRNAAMEASWSSSCSE